jgi:hypothetical protein
VNNPDLQRIVDAALSTLSEGERRSSAVYLDIEELAPGEPVPIGRKAMTFPARGYLAFVDPSPTANWGHPCRYLFVESETQRVREIPAQFPPFLSAVSATLRLIWKGSDVPEAVLATVPPM